VTTERWPDFIIVGAGKSGTTALDHFLGQHPDIFMSKKKEPNFFSLEGVDPDSYEFPEARAYHFESVYEKAPYLELFKDASGDQVAGENSNLYMVEERTAKRIRETLPDVRIIAMIRQPADRLFSRYQHMLREDKVPAEGFDRVFDRSSLWWRRADLIIEGFYAKNLRRFYDLFPKEQIRVYLYDDFRKDTGGVLKDIFEFIGVSGDFKVDTDMVVNKSGVLKKNVFNRLLGQNGSVVRGFKRLFPAWHGRLKGNKEILKRLNNARNKQIVKMDFDPELRKKITEEIYFSDIQELEKLLGRDLSHWTRMS
jgi:hypothetical protein